MMMAFGVLQLAVDWLVFAGVRAGMRLEQEGAFPYFLRRGRRAAGVCARACVSLSPARPPPRARFVRLGASIGYWWNVNFRRFK